MSIYVQQTQFSGHISADPYMGIFDIVNNFFLVTSMILSCNINDNVTLVFTMYLELRELVGLD